MAFSKIGPVAAHFLSPQTSVKRTKYARWKISLTESTIDVAGMAHMASIVNFSPDPNEVILLQLPSPWALRMERSNTHHPALRLYQLFRRHIPPQTQHRLQNVH